MVQIPDVNEFLRSKERPEMWKVRGNANKAASSDVPWEELCPECGQEYVEADIELVGGTVYMDAVCHSGHEYTIKNPPTYEGAFW